LAYTVQKEVDLLIQPAIERLKDKGRERDRATQQYLEAKRLGLDEDDEEDDN
jgi:hypothetical protein